MTQLRSWVGETVQTGRSSQGLRGERKKWSFTEKHVSAAPYGRIWRASCSPARTHRSLTCVIRPPIPTGITYARDKISRGARAGWRVRGNVMSWCSSGNNNLFTFSLKKKKKKRIKTFDMYIFFRGYFLSFEATLSPPTNQNLYHPCAQFWIINQLTH